MIIEIILINFFKKYYMNKKLKNTIINNYPIISIIILGLIYLYLEYPNNILVQSGGAKEKTWSLPSNIPFMYKYKYALISVPFLLVALIIYHAYFDRVVLKQTSIWDLGHDFFSNFQKQYFVAVSNPAIGVDNIKFDYLVPEQLKKNEPDLAKFFNMIQVTADYRSGGYIKAQYFCNSTRPCNCCLDDAYVKYFFGCSSAARCTDPRYIATCKPK